MKLFKLKRKNIILVSLLAIAGFLGISSVAVNTATSKEAPVAEKAEGASSGSYIYLENSPNNWFAEGDKVALWDWASSTFDEFTLFGTSGFYRATLSGDMGGFNIVRGSALDWGSIHNQGGNDDIESYNLILNTGYSGSTMTYDKSNLWTVTFNDNGHGTAPATQYIKDGNKASEPSDPSASGYSFGGWYKEAKCTNAWNFSTENVAADTILYAKWTAITYEDLYVDCSVDKSSFDDNVYFHYWGAGVENTVSATKVTNDTHYSAGLITWKASVPLGSSFQIFHDTIETQHYVSRDAGPFVSGTNLYILGAQDWSSGSNYGKYTWGATKSTDGTVKSFAFKKVVGGSTTDLTDTHYLMKGEDFALSGIEFPSVTGYDKPSNWKENSTSGTSRATNYTYTNVSDNYTMYAIYNIHSYSINYTYVIDGVVQDGYHYDGTNWVSGALTGSVNANYGTLFSSLPDPTYYGCSFDGWYSNSSCSIGLGTTAIAKDYSTSECYAKFTSDVSSSCFYIGINAGSGDNNQNTYLCPSWPTDSAGYTWIYYSNNSGSLKGAVKLKELTSISVLHWKFFRFYLPSDATLGIICKGKWGNNTDGYQLQTINLNPGSGTSTSETSYANGHNLFIVDETGQTDRAKRIGEWKDIQYYLEVASNTDFTSNYSQYTMSAPNNASTGNTAEALNIAVSNSYYIRGKYVVNGSTGYNKVRGGDDGGETPYTSQSDGVGVKFSKGGTFNIYINREGQIFVVDCGGIDAGGYIYIGTDLKPSDIKISVTIGGNTPFSSAKLSTVTDVTYVTNLTYGGIKGMIKVPAYNLRGSESVSTGASYTISLTDGTQTTNLTGLTVLTNGTIFYVPLSSEDTWSKNTSVTTYSWIPNAVIDTDAEGKAAAAKLSYLTSTYVTGADNQSVCNVSKDKAKTICETYDVLGNGQSFYTSSSITTWNSTKPTYSGSRDASMNAILYQLSKITNDGVSRGTYGLFGNFGLFGDSESTFSTLIIIISSSVALLSVTALSILVIRKRKSKED